MQQRVILFSQGLVTQFKALLPHLTSDVEQAYHEIMYVVVETIRYRDKAMREIVTMIKGFETNIDYGVMVKDEIIHTLKKLAMELYFQAEEFNLYNDRGILMFTYCRHPDFLFDDVLLTGIIQLTYNGRHYVPPI